MAPFASGANAAGGTIFPEDSQHDSPAVEAAENSVEKRRCFAEGMGGCLRQSSRSALFETSAIGFSI